MFARSIPISGNPNYDAIQTTTIEKYVDLTLRDQIFDSSALLRLIKERVGGVSTDGGQVLTEPIMYTKNNTVGSYRGHDKHDNSPQGGITQAQYDWKQYVASVVISGMESDVQNTGGPAQIKLLDAKMTQAEESLIDKMNEDLYLDGTGNGGKNLVGLALAVDSAGTYGNINRTTETYWSAIEIASGALTLEGGTTSMQRLHARCSKGGGKQSPDLYLTTSIAYQAYEAFFTPDRRFADRKLADYGFESLKFKTADVTWDEECGSGLMYALNTKTFKFVSHPSRNFAVVGPLFPTDSDSKVWKIYWAGALICKEPRRNGKLTGITNT